MENVGSWFSKATNQKMIKIDAAQPDVVIYLFSKPGAYITHNAI